MDIHQWDLDPLYKGLEDKALHGDIEELHEKIALSKDFFSRVKDQEQVLVEGIKLQEEVVELSRKIFYYLNLILATDTSNTYALGLLNKGRRILASFNAFQVKFARSLGQMDLEEMIQRLDLGHYRFILEEKKNEAHHLLSEEEEELLAQVNIYGVNAWENLFDQLTSKVSGEFQGQELGLSQLRNLAYDPDPKVRKEAYKVELSLYPKIEDSLAMALCSIKGQVNYLARKRGYRDALDQTMDQSRMDRKSLEALIGAMEAELPIFHRYFKAKAKILGQEKLAWADLFAPVGKLPAGYSIDSSRKALAEAFAPLHKPIAQLIDQAHRENWIDFFPRQGKVGGAFCENLPYIKSSRILTNFDGSFNAVDTLAHELGHAYHGHLIEDMEALNLDYTMPVAETASTFNEIHFLLEAIKTASSKEDKLGLLESFLMGNAQTTCDILSRFLFEKEVFERVDHEMLSPKDLCQIMHGAQKKAYGDNLLEESLHPYMWACKGHYYSASLSYYNFPYAFGSLYAMSLYQRAKEEGASFMEDYDKMLKATTRATCEEVGDLVGMDLRHLSFWQNAMKAFEPYIEEFEQMAEEISSNGPVA